MDRIEQIRKAAEEYGKRPVENMQMAEKLGPEIIAAFDRYLTLKGGLVIGVTRRFSRSKGVSDQCCGN